MRNYTNGTVMAHYWHEIAYSVSSKHIRTHGMCAMQEPAVSLARADGNNETQLDKYVSFHCTTP
jgi:hypothetical protein